MFIPHVSSGKKITNKAGLVSFMHYSCAAIRNVALSFGWIIDVWLKESQSANCHHGLWAEILLKPPRGVISTGLNINCCFFLKVIESQDLTVALSGEFHPSRTLNLLTMTQRRPWCKNCHKKTNMGREKPGAQHGSVITNQNTGALTLIFLLSFNNI